MSGMPRRHPAESFRPTIANILRHRLKLNADGIMTEPLTEPEIEYLTEQLMDLIAAVREQAWRQ
jgi:hypothetical protein